MPDDHLFHRPGYAEALAGQLLQPSALQQSVRSGVFLSGIRRVGKTTFLRQDLIPALEARGAVVVYVDLWTDMSKSPAALVHEAVRRALGQLQTPGSVLLGRLKGANIGAAGFSFGFQIDSVGAPGGTTLAQAFVELVATVKTNVVLIIDEVQQALLSDDGKHLMHALKAARDAVNAQPDAPGYFLFLGTGSHKSLVTDMASRRSQPFTGGIAAHYEVLGRDFVEWQLQRVGAAPRTKVPSVDTALAGFLAMGSRPEELLKALRQLQDVDQVALDQAFTIICDTLATVAADTELRAIDDLGELGKLIFGRIAAGSEAGVSGLFSGEALADYTRSLGSTVEAAQVQAIAGKMIAANLIARPGHGIYTVADPFVRGVWRRRGELAAAFSPVLRDGTAKLD